jgi:hypothetical protein
VEFLAMSGARKAAANEMIHGVLIGASHERRKAGATPMADISAEAMVGRVEKYCAAHRDKSVREAATNLVDQLVAEWVPVKSHLAGRHESN